MPIADADALEFLDKLGQFHSTLPENQQVMLDELIATALHSPEVEGYTAPGTTQPIPAIRGQLFGQLSNTSLSYYRYYASVAQLL
jgi:hypothetical protein